MPATRSALGVELPAAADREDRQPGGGRPSGDADGALPCRLCSSSDPSPVTTRTVPGSRSSKPTRSSMRSIPGRSSAPSRARAANPTPPAAPAPGRSRWSPAPRSVTTSAQRARALSRTATSSGSRSLLWSVDRRGTRRSEQRVVDVAGDDEACAVGPRVQAGPVEPSQGGQRGAAGRQRTTCLVEQPHPEGLEQPRATVGACAAADAEHHLLASGLERREHHLAQAAATRRSAAPACLREAGPARRRRPSRRPRSRHAARTPWPPRRRSGRSP